MLRGQKENKGSTQKVKSNVSTGEQTGEYGEYYEEQREHNRSAGLKLISVIMPLLSRKFASRFWSYKFGELAEYK